MNNSLIKKFIEYGIGSIMTLLLGFITSPIITRMISPEQNGRFSMFNTLTNLLMVIILLGLDQSYVRYYYEEESKNRGNLIRFCIKIPIVINIVLAVIILIFHKQISFYIVEETSLGVSVLLIVNLFVNILSRFSLLQVRMKQRGKLYSFINIFNKILNLLFVLLFFVVYKNNYMTLILASILSNLFVTMLAIYIEREEWCRGNKGELKSSKNEIIKLGIPLIFSMAITWVFQSIDRITIKEFAGYSEVGLYSGAMTIISLLNAVQNTFTTFWTPVALEKYLKKPDDKEFFFVINKIVTIVMLLIALVLILFKEVIVLLLGYKYREAVFIFPFLVFMPIMYTISETTVIGINFKKKTQYHVVIASISAIANIIGNIILVPKFGAKGAAISTGLAYMIFFAIRTYYSQKNYYVNYELKKFSLCVLSVYIFAVYSSFNTFNFTIIMLFMISWLIIFMCYSKFIFGMYRMYIKERKI